MVLLWGLFNYKFKCKKMTINKININVDDYYEYNDIIFKINLLKNLKQFKFIHNIIIIYHQKKLLQTRIYKWH